MKTLVSILVLVCVLTYAYSYPVHASCKLTWSWPKGDCAVISLNISDQMLKWKGFDNCNNTEKCGYTLKSNSSTEIKGTHTTPVKKYVDDLTMSFSGDGKSCEVKGYSTSETWYAHLDYSTNYCNLHNLVRGSRLNKVEGFEETSSDSDCTQYTSNNCDKY